MCVCVLMRECVFGVYFCVCIRAGFVAHALSVRVESVGVVQAATLPFDEVAHAHHDAVQARLHNAQ